jgi:hypothetical protein
MGNYYEGGSYEKVPKFHDEARRNGIVVTLSDRAVNVRM